MSGKRNAVRFSLSLRARSWNNQYETCFFIIFRGPFFPLDAIFLLFLKVLLEFVVVTKMLQVIRKKSWLFRKCFRSVLCNRWNVLCSRHHLLPFFFYIHAPIFSFLSRGGKEKEKIEGKKKRGPFLSSKLDLGGLSRFRGSLYLLHYPVTLYLYIWCLVVEISSTATMPVEKR